MLTCCALVPAKSSAACQNCAGLLICAGHNLLCADPFVCWLLSCTCPAVALAVACRVPNIPRATGHGAGKVQDLPDDVLLRCVYRDQARMGLNRQ